ncbi:MAG: hypothetical protein E7413_01850 [Ruminococcaceae bacterium]|nr:hypothetical protein [Oscillospiraceae bacterium]
MKQFKKIIAVIAALSILLTVSVLASGDDPVISLSYLSEIFMPKVEKKIAENSVFNVVTVDSGKTFVAGAGCEFIIRSGEAVVNSSAQGGLADTTAGMDLTQGIRIPLNHLLIAPRDDGRGFVAVSNTIIMVKGSYEVR